jgi:hypothetical protein
VEALKMEGGAPVVKGIPWIILAILFYAILMTLVFSWAIDSM